jgi:hypothetical protein
MKKTIHDTAFSHGVMVAMMGQGRGPRLMTNEVQESELEMGVGEEGEVGRKHDKNDPRHRVFTWCRGRYDGTRAWTTFGDERGMGEQAGESLGG